MGTSYFLPTLFYFHTHSYLFTYFLSFFISFHSYCSRVHELISSYGTSFFIPVEGKMNLLNGHYQRHCSAVFGSSSDSSLPPLIGAGGGLGVGPFWWKAVQVSSRSVIHLLSVSQSHYLCLQVTGGEAAPAGSGSLWWHWPIGYVSSFFEEDSWGSGPSSRRGISAAPSFG